MGMTHEPVQDPAVVNERAINGLYAQIAELENKTAAAEGAYRRAMIEVDIFELRQRIGALEKGTEVPEETRLHIARKRKQLEVHIHDESAAVNQFTLSGKPIWLPKETRVGLVNSINAEKGAGKSGTILWFDSVRYEIPIEQALRMLGTLELYALECYNVTHRHLSEIGKLATVEEVAGYDYTKGYPAKLNFDDREIVCLD